MNQLVHSAPKATRTNDPARTMAGILEVATAEFAAKGLSGARIDAIADATQTSKRMIYYYFGSKEGLYVAVLEEAYRRMRQIESELHLEDLEPTAALRRLVEFTFDHHADNEDYIRLVMNENIERGAYLAQSKSIQELNVPAIQAIRKLYDRGVASGVFRPGLEPLAAGLASRHAAPPGAVWGGGVGAFNWPGRSGAPAAGAPDRRRGEPLDCMLIGDIWVA